MIFSRKEWGQEDEVKCEECGYEGIPKVFKTIEFCDRDGNRGMEITWVQCPVCKEDLDYVTGI